MAKFGVLAEKWKKLEIFDEKIGISDIFCEY
jgi:hypothetical protein